MIKKTIFILVLSLILIPTGCSKKVVEIEKDYSKYLGSWHIYNENMYTFTALEGVLGRTAIDILEIEGNKLKGEIVTISGAPSLRIAQVEFEGEIVDNKLMAEYEDNSWNYSGNVELEFIEDHIIGKISRDENNGDSFIGWGILEGDFKFIRPIYTEIVDLNDEKIGEIEKLADSLEEEKLFPKVQMILKDIENKDIYYVYIDYKRSIDNNQDQGETVYQNIIQLEKSNGFTIKEVKVMDYILDFNMANDFLK